MRRTVEQALRALEQQIEEWARDRPRPEVRVFVYPPEEEPVMLPRMRVLAEHLTAEGKKVIIEEVGRGFLRTIEQRTELRDRLLAVESEDPSAARRDFGVLAERYLRSVLSAPVEEEAVCRVLVDVGSLATLVSYSTIINDLYGADLGIGELEAPAILAFPGEGDDRSLNLLRLRADTNYRVPRI